jgi:hypothetical protein
MSLIDKVYPDTYSGGQQCRWDVDSQSVILNTKEPEGFSKEFLRGFRNPNADVNDGYVDFGLRRRRLTTVQKDIKDNF